MTHRSKNSITKINIGGKQYVQPIQSLLRFIVTAQDLGITIKHLSQVQQVYVQLCMPELQGQIVLDDAYTKSNWTKIISKLSIIQWEHTRDHIQVIVHNTE